MIIRNSLPQLALIFIFQIIYAQRVWGWGVKKVAEAEEVQGDPNVKDREVKGTTERTVPFRTHTIYAPYVDSDLQNRYFDFGGSAFINTNRHIRLTQDRKSQAGWLWSRQALINTAFEVEVEFKIDGKGNTMYGDGFAMWLATTPDEIGPVFGSKDQWEGIGIFVDTYPNSRHAFTFPRIQAIINDGTKTYDVGNDGYTQEAGACSLPVRRTDVSTKLKFTYFREEFLEVQIHYEKWDIWSHCFTIYNYTLPLKPYLGFTAHTGDVSDAHDVVAVFTHGVVYHKPKVKGKQVGPGGRSPRAGGFHFGWMSGLLKWIAVLVGIALAFIGVRSYMAKRKRGSLKRF